METTKEHNNVQTKQSTLASAKDTIHSETDDSDALRPDGLWNVSKLHTEVVPAQHNTRHKQTLDRQMKRWKK